MSGQREAVLVYLLVLYLVGLAAEGGGHPGYVHHWYCGYGCYKKGYDYSLNVKKAQDLRDDQKIWRCAKAAIEENIKIFGVKKDGTCFGWCDFSDLNSLETANNCRNGVGSTKSYYVYYFKQFYLGLVTPTKRSLVCSTPSTSAPQTTMTPTNMNPAITLWTTTRRTKIRTTKIREIPRTATLGATPLSKTAQTTETQAAPYTSLTPQATATLKNLQGTLMTIRLSVTPQGTTPDTTGTLATRRGTTATIRLLGTPRTTTLQTTGTLAAPSGTTATIRLLGTPRTTTLQTTATRLIPQATPQLTTTETVTSTVIRTTASTKNNGVDNEPYYWYIGCFKDIRRPRAMPDRLRTWSTKITIEECAKESWKNGYEVFGVQHFGRECWSGVNAALTYAKYGHSNACSSDGVGGDWANDVYAFVFCPPGYTNTMDNATCQPCPVDTYQHNKNKCQACEGQKKTWGRKAVANEEQCTGENPIKVPSFTINIAPDDVPPGLIVANFTASYKSGSLVIPPLTYMITGVTKTPLQTRTTDVTSGDIDSCSQPTSNSSFPFCIYKHNGSIAINQNFKCSEGDEFVISINVSDSGNDTIGKIVNPNGQLTIACLDECKDVKPLYQKARNACPKTNITVQIPDSRQEVVDTTNIHAIHEVHVTNITGNGCNSLNITIKQGLRRNQTDMAHFSDISSNRSLVYRFDNPFMVTEPVLNITLLSNGCITSSSLTLVTVPKHRENCSVTGWTCLDAVFNWTNSLDLGKCRSDPDKLRMRYGHCLGICLNETTGQPNIKGVFTWSSARIGETRTFNCPYGESSATRRCGGNFNTGAEWNTPDDDNCNYMSKKTQKLKKLTQIKLSSDNAKEVAENFTKLFKLGSSKDMSEADANFAADMVDKILSVKDRLNETADMVVEIIDTMMEMNASSLKTDVSTRIIKAMDKLAENIPLEEGTTSRVLNSTNLVIQANKVNPSSFKGSTFGIIANKEGGRSVVTSADQTNLFVKLPTAVFEKSNKDSSVRIGFIYFANHNLFNVEDEDNDIENEREPSKEVLSASVYNNNANTSTLSENVTLTFPRPAGKDLKNSSCVFWKENERTWSGEGCVLCDDNGDDKNSIQCCCNHLTSFAVLFSPEKEPLSGKDEEHARILSIISYVGCGISLAGVILTFLTYSLFRHLRKTNQQPILMNLCVSIALLLIVFAVGIDRTGNRRGCQIVAGLLHYLTLTTIFWMGIEGYNLYLQLVKVMNIYHHKFMLKASIVAWGVPALIVVATVIAAVIEYEMNEDSNRVFYYGNEKVCILHNHLYRIVSWFAPILAILLLNLVMFVLVMYKINSTGAMVPVDTKSNLKKRCWTALAIMSLLGLTWIFGALAISGARLVFEYLFCIFNSLQGFFIFFFHCARIKEVRNQWSFFMSGLGFSHKESETSHQRSRGIGESRHSSEAPYVKVKKWILRKESDSDQTKRKITMSTVIDNKNVQGNVCDDNKVDMELDDIRDLHENDALELSFESKKRGSCSSKDSSSDNSS